MGREAIATCHWRGDSAEVKALLEGTVIILRGDIRLKLPRDAIEATIVDGNNLIVTAAGERLVLGLGAKEAQKWQAALLKPLPSLAEKLGVSAQDKAFVIGAYDDAELTKALEGARASDIEDATMLIAILHSEADLHTAIDQAMIKPDRHIWCVAGKGKFATIPESTIRTTMRARGFVDSKTSGISDRLTATRYRKTGC